MDKTVALPINKNLRERAVYMRKNPTYEEKKIWFQLLKDYRPKFHRQRIIGNYIVDFFCPQLRVIIEIDGYQHYYEENREYDERRTKYLEELGFVVLRFDNSEVNKDFEYVKYTIHQLCDKRILENIVEE